MLVAAMLIAGALGAWARYEVSGWARSRASTGLPWGTALVNVAGTVLLAALIAAERSGLVDAAVVAVVGTGFAGAFTTFSTWMVESAELGRQGGHAGLRSAAANVGGQLLAGSALAFGVLSIFG